MIDWLTKEQGGRDQPPSDEGPTAYRPQIRFVNDRETTPEPLSWSLAVWNDPRFSDLYRWMADISFVFDEAPRDDLREGREFELYQGRRCVARGKILGESLITADQDRATTSA